MFGTSKRQQQEIDSLRARNRELEGLVGELARRAGVGEAELFALRGRADAGITPQIEQELARGNKIMAIKLYREGTGVGLKEAKDAIDDLDRRTRGPLG